MEFNNNLLEEQETTILIMYSTKEVICYTARKATYKRLLKKLGEPTDCDYRKGKITGATWNIPFEDKKKLKAVFSSTTIIGQC